MYEGLIGVVSTLTAGQMDLVRKVSTLAVRQMDSMCAEWFNQGSQHLDSTSSGLTLCRRV